NIASDPRWVVNKDLHAIPQTGSAIGIPFSTDNKVDAVLILAHNDVDYFTSERLAFLEEVTEIAEYAIRNLKQHDTFKERTFDTRYEAIFEHTPVPVVLTDENGIIVDANYQACEFLGFQRIVLRGIPF
ncbi:MAG: PAS domain-containing protein, partial [Chloroflexota bacterium]